MDHVPCNTSFFLVEVYVDPFPTRLLLDIYLICNTRPDLYFHTHSNPSYGMVWGGWQRFVGDQH